ncbi:conserved hypothetical protein [Hyella patelloides LEGE 07179]|uniref:Uncharacterized protein n=1 Tax=Hyella patelloides LEGE 07179 TaxID=945734 RepID=A0A563VUZ1_9CYAN|nr:hypothetical protein [Hyella patelloides]VEP15250.1 conserved hypothetical protein [Hyella patelloides LEGE 07179]
MQVLGAFNKFEQCVLNMALINICDSESYVGQEMRGQYNAWKRTTDETVYNPWLDIHKFTIYLPHPDQEYEDVTLEEGLTKGYNIEVEPVKDPSKLVYNIPEGGHFVVVLKQRLVNGNFEIAATGIFVRSLGILSLDVIVDPDEGEYQSLMVKHPIIRDYPQDWETKLKMFLQGEIRGEELSRVVGYVDRGLNRDFRPPSWNEVYLGASGFAGF